MFHSARLKLTAWYLLIIMLISITSSAVIYRVLVNEVKRLESVQRFRMEQTLQNEFFISPDGQIHSITQPLPVNTELIDDASKRIFFILLIINAAILVLSGVFGYLLAGRTLQPIQEMVEEQNRFISDASHELRTPLTALKTSFEVFLRDKRITVAKAKNTVTEGLDDINLLQSLIDSLLQLAQYEKPNGSSVFESMLLNESITEAVQRIRTLARTKKITIKESLLPVSIVGNRYALLDLWLILLDNAVKYSPSGKQVNITVKKQRNHAVVEVIDQGEGIKKEDMPFIFDRFYRANKARSKEAVTGYGLGLSIAKKIVELHKGSIIVMTEVDKGTTFRVQLPTQQRSNLPTRIYR